jgi:hypothetical protein
MYASEQTRISDSRQDLEPVDDRLSKPMSSVEYVIYLMEKAESEAAGFQLPADATGEQIIERGYESFRHMGD